MSINDLDNVDKNLLVYLFSWNNFVDKELFQIQ